LGSDVSLSNTQQDYIKTIWKLEENFQTPKMKLIAEEVGVKPPTVSAMIRQLEGMDLVTYNKQTGACLTSSGKREAEKIIRNHRLIETFLQKVLKLEEPLLHNEAEKLEHSISDYLIAKIDAYLGYPSTDPHGSKIPDPDQNRKTCKLNEIEQNIEFSIYKIPSAEKENAFCQKNGFIPGSMWSVKQIGPDKESFLLTDGQNYLALSALLAKETLVEIIEI
jgi:DtxR family Mn-dependent transcriptional regulator